MREGNSTVTVLTLGQDPTTPLMAATKRYVDNNVANALSLSLAGIPSGQIIFSKGSSVGGNANLYFDNTNVRLGIGTSTPAYALDFAGNGVTGRFGTTGDNILTTSGTSLTFSQTGDADGYSAFTIMNRNGMNGAQFSTLNAPNQVVDFLFTTGTTASPITRNLRLEVRANYATLAGVPAFHMAGTDPDVPALALGDTTALFNTDLWMGGAGQIYLGNGTVTNPSETFFADQSTGVYQTAGGGNWHLTVGGVDQLVVQNSASAACVVVAGTTALQMPTGTLAQRPTAPVSGMFRYNTTYTTTEVYDGGMWTPVHPYRHPGFATGRYYGTAADGSTLSTATVATGTIYAVPFYRTTNMSFDRIGCEVTSALSGANVRIAVYDNYIDGNGTATGLPGALLYDSGSITAATAAIKEITVSNVVSSQRWFWLAIQTSASVGLRATVNTTGLYFMGRASSSTTGVTAVTATYTYGAYPSTFPTSNTTTTANVPFLWVRNV